LTEENYGPEIIKLLEKIVNQTQLKAENPKADSGEVVHHTFNPDCPTCKPLINAYVNPLLEKAREDLVKIFKERSDPEKYRYECVGDGCGVEKGEKECPICHGTQARKR